ncbi:MAG: zinc-binding dehydrogenase [Leptonema sp. (in: bacteria)]
MKNISYVQTRAGNLKNYKIEESDLQILSDHKVRVQIKAVGLNFADIFACLGLYSATPKGSFSPGLEYAGVIVEKGKKVNSPFKEGDEVLGTTKFGALTNYLDVNPNYLYPKPKDWTFEESASFIVQALTAWYGLVELGRLKKDSMVLLQSAAGGVGLHSIQILNHFSANYCAIIGNSNKKEILKKYDVKEENILIRDKNINKFYKDLKVFLKNKHKRGFDLIFDSVSGKYLKVQFSLLDRMGIYIIYGASDLMSNTNKPNYLWLVYKYLTFYRIMPLKLLDTNRGIFGFNIIWLYDKIDLFRKMIQEMQQIQWKKPYIDKVFDFKDSYQALKYLQSGTSIGKVIIRI